MKQLTVKQYQTAISENALSLRQIQTLQILYNQPNASSTSNNLAHLINPSNPATIIASGSIGKIGKAFAKYFNITPEVYFDGRTERPAYFTIVSKIYDWEYGWTMYKNLQIALENLGLVSSTNKEVVERLTTEMQPYEDNKLYYEGKLVTVKVNRYERNQDARIECIKHHGVKCKVCGFDFEEVYGKIASSYIHVHHLKQLSEIKKQYRVDPINDLIPVCANCHSVIHLTNPAMTIEKIQKIIKRSIKLVKKY